MAALLAAGAACLVGVAIVGLGGGDTETYPATIETGRIDGASAELEVSDGAATLVVEGLPEPDGAYQVWLMPKGSDTPEPSVLFLPGRDGAASVTVPGVGDDVEAVLVSTEPASGSPEPTSQPILAASLS